jgi:23S rRNA-/tRNA-specific pseudouridylate synthase
LRLNGDRKHRTVMDVRRGKPSITHLRVLERFDSYTLVEACPETGRRHQIRAHLAALGFPIAGDDLYGNRLSSPIDRSSTDSSQESLPGDLSLALHARALEFTHPIHGDRLWLEAPYPMQFQNTLRGLRSAPRPFRKQLVITHKYSPRTGKGAKKRKIGS